MSWKMNKRIVWEYLDLQIEREVYVRLDSRANSSYEDGWTRQFYLDNPTYLLKSGKEYVTVVMGRVTMPNFLFDRITSMFRIDSSEFESITIEWLNNLNPKLKAISLHRHES